MVSGVWLLTYASYKGGNGEDVPRHQRPRRQFVGIVVEPIEDIDDFVQKREPVFSLSRGLYGLDIEFGERLPSSEGTTRAPRSMLILHSISNLII
jgi:hypothetical protein